jgi:hypothetical protein
MKISAFIFFVIFLFYNNVTLFAQEFIQDDVTAQKVKEHKFDKERLFFGGGFGLQFGDINLVSLAPEVGYRFTDKFNAGIGVSYFYISFSGLQGFSTNIYGGKVFGSFTFFENLFIHSEYELLNLETQYFNPTAYPENNRFNIGSFFVGPGYRFKMGEHSSVNLLMLWNLNETAFSPYENPVLRMSFEF